MEEEFLDIDSKNAWGLVYQQIRSESSNFNYTFKDAKKVENKNLNRYRDVNPYDHTRVRLERGDKDYINASLVKVAAAKRAYILTQGPLPITTGHFWLMVWEQKSKAVLMLNRVIEKNAVKCHQYWPLGASKGGDNEMILTDVRLKVRYLGETEVSYYTVTELLLSDIENGKSRVVLHFHYTTWPDFGVPESPAAFLNFLMAVRESGALDPSVGPAVVHCSAGIGRSGTFCLVDSCLVLIEENGDPNSVSVREVLLDMRRYRMGLIQTPDQLRFSYLAIKEGAKNVLARKQTDDNVPFVQHSNLQDGPLPVKNSDEKIEEPGFSEESEDELVVETNSDDSEEGRSTKALSDTSGDTEPPPPLPPRAARQSVDLSPTSLESFSNLDRESAEFSVLLTENQFNKSEFVKNEHSNSEITDSMKQNNRTEKDCVFIGNEKGDSQEFSNSQETVLSDSSPSSPDILYGGNNEVGQDKTRDAELRKRKRRERLDKTAETVQKMRSKQKESEAWLQRRSRTKETKGSRRSSTKRAKK